MPNFQTITNSKANDDTDQVSKEEDKRSSLLREIESTADRCRARFSLSFCFQELLL